MNQALRRLTGKSLVQGLAVRRVEREKCGAMRGDRRVLTVRDWVWSALRRNLRGVVVHPKNRTYNNNHLDLNERGLTDLARNVD
jgi:hypothetical protein